MTRGSKYASHSGHTVCSIQDLKYCNSGISGLISAWTITHTHTHISYFFVHCVLQCRQGLVVGLFVLEGILVVSEGFIVS